MCMPLDLSALMQKMDIMSWTWATTARPGLAIGEESLNDDTAGGAKWTL